MVRSWKKTLKKLWFFIWEDDSILSWIVNVILAFIIVKFIIYPLLGLFLGTSYPIVAVVSGSMEHNSLGFNDWWDHNKEWYVENGLTEDVIKSKLKNGFNKGDIIILKGIKPRDIKPGTIIVYQTDSYKYPIIHRVTKISRNEEGLTFQTKGDNNNSPDPLPVKEEKILGRAVLKLPWLGWIKLLFTNLIGG